MYKCSIIRTLWLDFVIFPPKISPKIPKRLLTRLLIPDYNYTNQTDLFALFARMVHKLFVIFIIHVSVIQFVAQREKGRVLTRSYDKSPYTHRKKKYKRDNTQTQPKTSIIQRLRFDLGRSVRVTIVTQLVWLNRFKGSQPFH